MPMPAFAPVLNPGSGVGVETLSDVLVAVALTEDGLDVREAEADGLEVAVGTCKAAQVSIRGFGLARY